MRLVAVLLVFAVQVHWPAWATKDRKEQKKGDCHFLLSNQPHGVSGVGRAEFRIIPSPRVPNEADKFEAYVHELVAPGGVLDRLGIEMTGQVVEFLQPRDLNSVTSGSSGGFPVAHYLDGAMVVQGLKPTGEFALEVVYPGPNFQHGFYRDDNPTYQQFSIIDHVVGHNNFALLSGLSHYRVGQGLYESTLLDRRLRSLYVGLNKDEVSRWYLWAQTLVGLVDWYTPLYAKSKEFEPDPGRFRMDHLGRGGPQSIRHPTAPTENVLPAFAANISSHEPEWKRAVLEHVMVSRAFQPALIHTQIMNEGWASIMQEILPAHTKNHHHFAFWVNASQVMQSEAHPNLSNPYSLGVFLWRRIRERFLADEKMAQLPLVERDARFIAHAGEIIRKYIDEDFIRLGMDQVFVDRHNLKVVRRAQDAEMNPNLPPPVTQEPVGQWVVVSRKAERVAEMVINKVLKPKYYFRPRVQLVDFNRPGSGEIELVLDDSVGRATPVKSETVSPALYALSRVIDKPVSLECSLYEEVKALNPDDNEWLWNARRTASHPGWDGQSQGMGHRVFRARIVVSPTAEVKVYRVTKEKPDAPGFFTVNRILEEAFDPGLTRAHSRHLAGYLEDLYLEDQQQWKELVHQSQSLSSLMDGVFPKIEGLGSHEGMVAQAGNAAGAVAEFNSMVQRRMLGALERATQKKGGLLLTTQGVRVRALPSVVRIEFDPEYLSMMKDSLPVTSVRAWSAGESVLARTMSKEKVVAALGSGPFGVDEAADGSVGPVNGGPGDVFWGPGDEPSESGSAGIQAGEDPDDLSWVDIPEDLYARFLGERVKLPILNKKSGESKTKSMRSGGSVSRFNGQLLPEEIMENALKRGIGVLGSEGADGFDPMEDLAETFAVGFDNLQPRDIKVKHRKPSKRPDVKAVVTFVLDASGSTAQYYEAFKRFVYDVEALVRHNYKGFDFKYVVFDTEAHVMKSKKDFFKAQLGGGTKYSVGIQKAHELFKEQYPRNRWDRYTFLLGDMEDFDPNLALADIKKLVEDSEYFGVVAGLYREPTVIDLMAKVMAEHQRNEAVGYTILGADGGYTIKNIREVLRNDDK